MLRWIFGFFLLFLARCAIVPKGTAITPSGMLVYSPYPEMVSDDTLQKLDEVLVKRLAQYMDLEPDIISKALDGVSVNVVPHTLKWNDGSPINGYYDPNNRIISVIGSTWFATEIGHEAIHAVEHALNLQSPCLPGDMESCHASWTPRYWQGAYAVRQVLKSMNL